MSGRVILLAAVLSASAAAGCSDVRDDGGVPLAPGAGQRTATVVYSNDYEIDLFGLEMHATFDIHRNRRVAAALVQGGAVPPGALLAPEEVSREDLLRVHTPEYLATLATPSRVADYLAQGMLRLFSAATIDRQILSTFRRGTGGTILAARRALAEGLAFNLGGGYHHAMPERGMGGCVYADVPVAVRVLQAAQPGLRVLVVDGNVHQGNGLAVCLAADAAVFTLSVFEADLWPPEKPPNDLDVGLKLPVDDAAYLAALEACLPRVLDEFRPHLVMFIAGVGVLAGDPNGHFEMTHDGVLRRDAYVVGQSRQRGAAVCWLAGGGFSKQAWRTQAASVAALIAAHGRERRQTATATATTPACGARGL